jgi:hypothetical protein
MGVSAWLEKGDGSLCYRGKLVFLADRDVP